MKKSYSEKLQAKRRFWFEHLRKMEQSDLSQVEYCRMNNLEVRRVWYWKRKLFKQTAPAALVQVPVNSIKSGHQALSQGSPIRMTVAGRYVLDIEKGFDPLTLRQTLKVVESL